MQVGTPWDLLGRPVQVDAEELVPVKLERTEVGGQLHAHVGDEEGRPFPVLLHRTVKLDHHLHEPGDLEPDLGGDSPDKRPDLVVAHEPGAHVAPQARIPCGPPYPLARLLVQVPRRSLGQELVEPEHASEPVEVEGVPVLELDGDHLSQVGLVNFDKLFLLQLEKQEPGLGLGDFLDEDAEGNVGYPSMPWERQEGCLHLPGLSGSLKGLETFFDCCYIPLVDEEEDRSANERAEREALKELLCPLAQRHDFQRVVPEEDEVVHPGGLHALDKYLVGDHTIIHFSLLLFPRLLVYSFAPDMGNGVLKQLCNGPPGRKFSSFGRSAKRNDDVKMIVKSMSLCPFPLLAQPLRLSTCET
mmetsp:Transcript_26148/g.59270  ORF Transcript_26148/g.59270 Transcript_26148/m.59270 type:complete len:358 (+) Transcript_26148:790-1863(+)